MANIKVRPPNRQIFYVGIDGTDATDTIAWGHLWHARFGWTNLLQALSEDPFDPHRRVDLNHPKLTIARLTKTVTTKSGKGGGTFADWCVMPQGVDGKGPNAQLTAADIRGANAFLHDYILSPGARAGGLTSGGGEFIAEVVFISGHGYGDGLMGGDYTPEPYFFDIAAAAAAGKTFQGPKWLLLSNCTTLNPVLHRDWLDLMTNGSTLRGVLGFANLFPGPNASAQIYAGFVRRLADGKTFVEAWKETIEASGNPNAPLGKRGLADHWIVLCHKEAAGDTMDLWNADQLPPLGSNQIQMFSAETGLSNPALVQPRPDPFTAFWLKWSPDLKTSTQITVSNKEQEASKLHEGDTVSIVVSPVLGVAHFDPGNIVKITLAYIRLDYPQLIDINAMFQVRGFIEGSLRDVRTANLNNGTPPFPAQRQPAFTSLEQAQDTKDDSWIVTVPKAMPTVRIDLQCRQGGLSILKETNQPLSFHVIVDQTSTGPFIKDRYDFRRNGAILAVKP